jgi:CRISPR-associated protein Csm1
MGIPAHLKEVEAAALLHDIGKFLWRGGRRDRRHQELSAEFVGSMSIPEVDIELVRKLVLYHHDGETYGALRLSNLPPSERKLARIICEADKISSGMDRESDEDGEPEEPLMPIFLEVRISEKDTVDEKAFFLPKALDIENIFPTTKEINTEELVSSCQEAWRGFEMEAKILPQGNFKAWYSSLNNLLKKYASRILSAGYKTKPDIPLYDHLKTTAAIASCLHYYCEEKGVSPEDRADEPRYLLIMGDLSGIQRFIYKVSDPQRARKGTAKRLRGRSFLLTLIMETAASEAVSRLGLMETNILWCTGGHFLILAPNLPWVTNELQRLKEEISAELLEKYEGEIFLAMRWAECKRSELIGKFGQLRDKLVAEVGDDKGKRFFDILEKIFVQRGENIHSSRACAVCEKKELREGLCEVCLTCEEIGGNVVKADYILIGKDMEPRFRVLGSDYLFCEKKDLSHGLNCYREKLQKVLRLNDTAFLDEEICKANPNIQFGFRFTGNVVPKKPDGDILSFDDLSKFSDGAEKIGILKADVDNLGTILTQGMKEKISISRLHTLSSLLEEFFSGYINVICLSKKIFYDICDNCKTKIDGRFKEIEVDGTKFYVVDEGSLCQKCREKSTSKIYINYSGGDDLLIMGPWDAVLEVAEEVRDKFRQFVCNNTSLTMSAGFVAIDPKFPVARGVEAAT